MKLNELKVFEMIKDLELTDIQLKRLAEQISDWLDQQGVFANGLEVMHVQDEGDVMKALFVYENSDGKERRDSVYFTAHIRDNQVTDFVEVK